ncbi:hypothetical protein KIK06_02745 [Nocardiopsis sp. EMB25]|uniref:hypothetical protein n=1 Tax=Nocardiopsis TaxID=2013 RepID=UPI000346307B|nr:MULTISPECIES: hypothetical protein [Nocardiopsis]MCY9782806.1 hypothetical protein [Nocardiopsis sp. EMB25]
MSNETPIQHGHVTATYFWDDGSGINGDTGAPAYGKPMQEGLFSSPSWPLGTEGYIVYEGEEYEFFIGDRGPGVPSHDCDVLLDIDGKTFAKMTGETFNDTTLTVSGGNGHAEVEYYITEWGDGYGTPGAPHPFQQPDNKCEDAVSPLPEPEPEEEPEPQPTEAEEEAKKEESAKDSDEVAKPKATEEQEDRSEEAAAADAQDGDDSGVTAQTAANDLSAMELTGADGALGATGLLTLALIPAVLIALFFAWTRRPSGAHAGAADGEGKGLLSMSSGRHALASLVDRLRRK